MEAATRGCLFYYINFFTRYTISTYYMNKGGTEFK